MAVVGWGSRGAKVIRVGAAEGICWMGRYRTPTQTALHEDEETHRVSGNEWQTSTDTDTVWWTKRMTPFWFPCSSKWRSVALKRSARRDPTANRSTEQGRRLGVSRGARPSAFRYRQRAGAGESALEGPWLPLVQWQRFIMSTAGSLISLGIEAMQVMPNTRRIWLSAQACTSSLNGSVR